MFTNDSILGVKRFNQRLKPQIVSEDASLLKPNQLSYDVSQQTQQSGEEISSMIVYDNDTALGANQDRMINVTTSGEQIKMADFSLEESCQN